MSQESLEAKVLYLSQVEKLSGRQIARIVGIGRKRLKRILEGSSEITPAKPRLLQSYRDLIAHWYHEYPHLKAKQIYERLMEYGYQGSYPTVATFTQSFRRPKTNAYHTLSFLPGEEAQIDWFFFQHIQR